MHPLTIFPQLLTYSFFAPFLLRLSVGAFGLLAGFDKYKKGYKWLAVLYIVPNILIILGLYTQVAAIVAIVLIKLDLYEARKTAPLSRDQIMAATLNIAILLSLLVTGPGAYAFDLPL